jgi:hypothetical protein
VILKIFADRGIDENWNIERLLTHVIKVQKSEGGVLLMPMPVLVSLL